MKPLSPTHTVSVYSTLPLGLQITQKPYEPSHGPCGSKATHMIKFASKCRLYPIRFPSHPAPLWLHHFTVFILPLFLILHVQEERGRKKRMTAYLTSRRGERLTSIKKPSFYPPATRTRSRKLFKRIPNKWKPLHLKIVLISVLLERRVKRVCVCIILSIILGQCQKGMILDLNNWWSTPTDYTMTLYVST